MPAGAAQAKIPLESTESPRNRWRYADKAAEFHRRHGYANDISFHQAERVRHDEAARKERDELRRIDREILGAFRDEEQKRANSAIRPTAAAPDPNCVALTAVPDESCPPAIVVRIPPEVAPPSASNSIDQPFETPQQGLRTPPASIQTPPTQNQPKSSVIIDGTGGPLNVLIPNDEDHSSSSATGSRGKRGTTTIVSPFSRTNGPDLTPIDTAVRQVCDPDARFVQQLFDLCRAQAPDCTVEEVVYFVAQKIAIKRRGCVDSWTGYLHTAVPRQFEGTALERFRASQTASNLQSQKNEPPFPMDKLRTHLERAAAALPSGYEEIAASLRKLAADDAEFAAAYADLENLSQWLELMEKKVIATALAQQTEEQVLESAREVERLLRPYRGTMTADQLSMLGKRYQEKVLLEKVRLPRLNIFYVR